MNRLQHAREDDTPLPSRLSLSIVCLVSTWLLGMLPSAAGTGPTQKPAPTFNVVALAEANSIHRPFVDAAKIWLQSQASENNFSIEYLENTDKIDDAFLSRFQVFIQLDYPPYGWTPKAVAAFTRYIEKGRGGWIGFHHATLLGEFDGYQMWNGKYFRYDTESEYRDSIQADQLAGQWYANLTGLGDLVPRDMQRSATKTIFEFNVMKFGGGEMGAANGMSADGAIIRDNEQAPEVWVGTSFGFAALLLSEGMKDEAYQTAWGLYHVIYESKGYWFRTPEAWDVNGNFRASMYMRPAAVWALEMMPPWSVPTANSQSPLNPIAK